MRCSFCEANIVLTLAFDIANPANGSLQNKTAAIKMQIICIKILVFKFSTLSLLII